VLVAVFLNKNIMEMIKLYSVLSYTERFELKKIIDEEIEWNNKLPLSEFIKVYKSEMSIRLNNVLISADEELLNKKVFEITNNDLCKIRSMGKKSLIEFNKLRHFK